MTVALQNSVILSGGEATNLLYSEELPEPQSKDLCGLSGRCESARRYG